VRNQWEIVSDDGIFWLQTPGGQRFYACGVNGVNAGNPPDTVHGRPSYYLWNQYASVDRWATVARTRLDKWGFNHLGAWSSSEDQIGLPYIANLDLGRRSRALWFDPFAPALGRRVKHWAKRLTAPHRERGQRIGYFPDNEVGWWNAALFTFYLSKEWENLTKQRLWNLLYERYQGRWSRLLDDWVPPVTIKGMNGLRRTGASLRLRPGGRGIEVINSFTFLCAERYYKLVHAGLRAADPHGLIFSDRLPIYYSQDAVRAMIPYVDVVAANYNIDGPDDGWIAHYFFDGLAALTGKPILVSEFFCAATENRTGNKNVGFLLTVPTQAQRARVTRNALRNFARFPSVVGTHWFQYYDEPRGGRADGEDYNMGLVDIWDRPYAELARTFARTNPGLSALHGRSRASNSSLQDGTPAVIPHARRPIDPSDRSLANWDRERSLMRGFAADPPYVPFADVHLAWDPKGLHLAMIGMDYMHPDHLACEEPFPLSETFQVHLLISVSDRAHHFAVHFLPHEVAFSAGDATNARGVIAFEPHLYTYASGRSPRPLETAAVAHLHTAAPRVSCAAHFPARTLGLTTLRKGMKLHVNVVIISHYRGHEMYWSGGTAAQTFTRPEEWRPVVLGQTHDRPR